MPVFEMHDVESERVIETSILVAVALAMNAMRHP